MCTKLCIISLVVQWLRLHASDAEAQVQSLVREVPHAIWCGKKKKDTHTHIYKLYKLCANIDMKK